MSSLNENMEYRVLSIDECDRISEIDPSQWIEKAWGINVIIDFEEYATSAIRFTTVNEKNYVLKRKDNVEKIDTEHELLKHIRNNG